MRFSWLACALLVGCEASVSAPAAPAMKSTRGWDVTVQPFALPGAPAPAFVDYIAFEPERARVWVPVGDTGSVDVFDIANHRFARVDGFKTASKVSRDRTRTIGPSAVGTGGGFAYVANRAANEICVVETATLTLGACVALPVAVDGVVYVAATKEVWVTAGDDKTIAILDASDPASLRPKASMTVGSAEGYAVDEARGMFFTNLEEEDETLAIDAAKHAVIATWHPGCGENGPRGLVLDSKRNLVIVACTDHLQVLDAGHDGALLGKLDTGAGVDNIDFLQSEELVYAAAGGAGRLTVARVEGRGELTSLFTVATAPGARNVVIDRAGSAFVADPRGARLLEVARAP